MHNVYFDSSEEETELLESIREWIYNQALF